jgi:hypothetical protein
MTTQTEYAQLALSAYPSLRLSNTPQNPPGWDIVLEVPTNIDGFACKAFRRTGTDEFVIAYCGSDQLLQDYGLANAPLAIGLGSGQLSQAAAVYLRIKERYGSAVNVSFTGHSLGGGLASVMSVWFDRPATVFDEAPFKLSAINPLVVAENLALLRGLGLSDPKFSVAAIVDFRARESNLTHYFASGKILIPVRAALPFISGLVNLQLPFGIDNMTGLAGDAIKLHSMELLAAGILSNDFRVATLAAQRALPLLLNADFYEYNATKSANQNLFFNFIRSEQGTGKKLTHFAADLQKIGTNLAGLNAQAQDALIAQCIEGYYWQPEAYSGEFFTATGSLLQYTTALGAGLPGALNKAADYVNKWLAPVIAAAGEVYQNFANRYYDQWNIAAGTAAVTANARDTAKRQIYVGQDGSDTFTGGDQADMLIGGGGAANDWSVLCAA